MNLTVSARIEGLDGGTIAIGTPFKVIIEAAHAPGEVALLPESLPFDATKLAERRDVRRHVRSVQDGSEIDRYELELLAFTAGDVEIPAIPLALGSTRAETAPIALAVATTFSDDELPVATATIPEAMAELEKMVASDPTPVAVFVEDHTPLYAAASLAIALITGWIVWRLLKNRKARVPDVVVPVAPPRPADAIALERFETLRKSGRLERDRKGYFIELSEILREYLGARWRFDSLEMTLDELLLALARRETKNLDIVKLKWILERADFVKFAKYDVDTETAAQMLIDATEVVERTREEVRA